MRLIGFFRNNLEPLEDEIYLGLSINVLKSDISRLFGLRYLFRNTANQTHPYFALKSSFNA